MPRSGWPAMALTFGLLIAAQAAHSIEEYVGRLWVSFPPARFVSSVVSSDLERGFVLFNVALVAFGVWCVFWPVRRGWPSARPLMWLWTVVEMINGLGHPLFSLIGGTYVPGTITAPVLFVVAVSLGTQLVRARPLPSG